MTEAQPLVARFGPFHLDEAQAQLGRDGIDVDMPPRAFQVLCELVRRAGDLVTKDALLDAVWGHRHVNEAALKNIVSQVRQALGDDARESVFIQTVSRRGYRFIAPLGGQAASPAAPALPQADGLVGRDAALARLGAALQAARAGERQFVLVAGEAGIGKSSLVEHFVQSAGVRVAVGQCVEHYGGAEPYMPVLEALNGLCRAEGGDAVVALMRRVAPTWLLQLPWFAEDEDRRALQHEAAGATQDRMLREFGELADRLTTTEPLLLVLEDLHSSDHATVQLLGYLARRRGGGALMLIGSFRPLEIILQEHPLASLRQELKPRRLCQEIELEYLSEADLGELLAARLGTPPPEDFVRALHAHTLGLPLFVVAVMEELATAGGEGALPHPGSLAVPSSMAGIIESQIARLSPEQQRALGAASVSGIEFLHLPLAQVLQMAPEALEALLEAAALQLPWFRSEGAHALADERIAVRYAFAHALYRQTLYERLPASQRMQWHRAWAAALADLHAVSPAEAATELALHLERGGAPLQAAEQLAVAASRAMARDAPQEALQAVRHGLRLAEGRMPQALELDLRSLEAVALTRVHVITGPEVVAALARARALGPAHGLGWQRTLQGCWWVHFKLAEYPQAQALGAEMLALAAQRQDAALEVAGHNAMGIVLMLMGEFAEARRHLEGAIDAYARLADGLPSSSFVQDPGVEASMALILVYWMTGDPARSRRLAGSTIERAFKSRNLLSEATALYTAAVLHALAGESDVVFSLTERLGALVKEHNLPERRGGYAWLHGQALVALGRVDEGLEEMLAAARNAREQGVRTGMGGFHYHYALACLAADRMPQAQASIHDGLAFAEEVGERFLKAPLLALRARLELAAGDRATALGTLELALATARAQGALFHELRVISAALAEGATLGEPGRLQELLAFYGDDPSPVIAKVRAQVG